jgi:hypothetical protein
LILAQQYLRAGESGGQPPQSRRFAKVGPRPPARSVWTAAALAPLFGRPAAIICQPYTPDGNVSFSKFFTVAAVCERRFRRSQTAATIKLIQHPPGAFHDSALMFELFLTFVVHCFKLLV